MSRRTLLVVGIVLVALAALAAVIIPNTYWDERRVVSPLKGEAARDPHYAAKLLVKEIGGTVSDSESFDAPGPESVIYLSNWNWSLGNARRERIENWVNEGGRLVVDETVYFPDGRFTNWSGISLRNLDYEDKAVAAKLEELYEEECRLLERQGQPVLADEAARRSYLLCDINSLGILSTVRPAQWSLHDELGMRAARVAVGRGSVTMLRASPFMWQQTVREDHPELFAAATQVRPGDHVRFISERTYPSLLALTWRYGWPALVPALLALALVLWRWSSRFGPLAADAPAARRSLAEQIRGTGRFLMQRGSGAALLAASTRALEAAARRAIPGFDTLDSSGRIAAIAAAAGTDQAALAQALALRTGAGARALSAAIVHLETIRHRIDSTKPRRRDAI